MSTPETPRRGLASGADREGGLPAANEPADDLMLEALERTARFLQAVEEARPVPAPAPVSRWSRPGEADDYFGEPPNIGDDLFDSPRIASCLPRPAMPAPRPALAQASQPRSTPGPTAFSIPPAPQSAGPARWLPPGRALRLGELVIEGGMLYVGAPPSRYGGPVEPSLIDPTKPVGASGNCAHWLDGHWLAYSEMAPTSRRAYLNWLADGRADPLADVRYVLLYFYGLERRVVADLKPDEASLAELAAIDAELARLERVYARRYGSIREHARALRDRILVMRNPPQLYRQPPVASGREQEVSTSVRLAVAQAARDHAPVPFELAFAWACEDPQNTLRTPALRCAEEFRRLFAYRFHEEYGEEGMRVVEGRFRLSFGYQPASHALFGATTLSLAVPGLFDASAHHSSRRALEQLLDDCQGELEAYSRLLGRSPAKEGSLEAMSLLPQVLWPDELFERFRVLAEQAGDAALALPLEECLTRFGAPSPRPEGSAYAAYGVALRQALGTFGLAMLPDSTKLPKDGLVVLYKVEPEKLQPIWHERCERVYAALQMALLVAQGPQGVSPAARACVVARVEALPQFPKSLAARLHASIELLSRQPEGLGRAKKLLSPRSSEARERVAQFLVDVALCEPSVTPQALRALEKCYQALGLDPQQVFSDVHARSGDAWGSGSAGRSARTAQSRAQDGSRTPSLDFALDAERIAQLRADSERTAVLLGDIFSDDEEPRSLASAASASAAQALRLLKPRKVEPSPGVGEGPPAIETGGEALVPRLPEASTSVVAPASASSADATLLGLNASHSDFARQLLARAQWGREELAALCAQLGLMLDGALEKINDACYDVLGEPFVEGEDPLDINPNLPSLLNIPPLKP